MLLADREHGCMGCIAKMGLRTHQRVKGRLLVVLLADREHGDAVEARLDERGDENGEENVEGEGEG